MTSPVDDNNELEKLLAIVRALPPMTPAERELQGLNFAYGNLACTTNHKPNRKAFQAIAMRHFDWSIDDLNAWADTKAWWP